MEEIKRYEVIIRPRAEKEIEAAYEYLSIFCGEYAWKFVAGMEKAILGLEIFPNGGSNLVNYNKKFKDLKYIEFRKYAIVYRVCVDKVYVETVYHMSRNPKGLEV